MGRILFSQPGRYQFAFPSTVISAGTKMIRITKASSATAMASARPNILMVLSSPNTNEMKTLNMMAAAAITTRPEPMRPRRTDLRLSPMRVHSSCIRDTRNTW